MTTITFKSDSTKRKFTIQQFGESDTTWMLTAYGMVPQKFNAPSAPDALLEATRLMGVMRKDPTIQPKKKKAPALSQPAVLGGASAAVPAMAQATLPTSVPAVQPSLEKGNDPVAGQARGKRTA